MEHYLILSALTSVNVCYCCVCLTLGVRYATCVPFRSIPSSKSLIRWFVIYCRWVYGQPFFNSIGLPLPSAPPSLRAASVWRNAERRRERGHAKACHSEQRFVPHCSSSNSKATTTRVFVTAFFNSPKKTKFFKIFRHIKFYGTYIKH